MDLVVAKIFLSPLCVVLVSMAGRRWGVSAAGILGGFPVVGGPILLAIALTHGSEFGAETANWTLLGLCALAAFAVVYTRCAFRFNPAISLVAGWAAFLLAIAFLSLFPMGPIAGMALATASFIIGIFLLPKPTGRPSPPLARPWWDLPARALSALTLVVLITTLSGDLGPEWSGLLAPFPIITAILAAFTHTQGTPQQVVVLIRSSLLGFNGYATFCFVLALALPSWGLGEAFLLATLVALAVQAAILLVRERQRRAALARGL
jgi:hypothetical protein